MIKSFKHKGLEKFFTTGNTKGIQAMHAEKLSRLLFILDDTDNLEDLNSPNYRLHKLKGDKNNLWSVTVQANWRLTFEFYNENVYILDYLDYH